MCGPCPKWLPPLSSAPLGGPRSAVHSPSGPLHAVPIIKHHCFFLEFTKNQTTFGQSKLYCQPCFLFSRTTHRLVSDACLDPGLGMTPSEVTLDSGRVIASNHQEWQEAGNSVVYQGSLGYAGERATSGKWERLRWTPIVGVLVINWNNDAFNCSQDLPVCALAAMFT